MSQVVQQKINSGRSYVHEVRHRTSESKILLPQKRLTVYMRVFNFLYSIIMNEMAKHFTFTAWNIKTLLEHVKVRYLHIPITMHYFSDHISVTPTCCAVSDSLSLSSRWIIAARSSSHILISSSMRAWNSSD